MADKTRGFSQRSFVIVIGGAAAVALLVWGLLPTTGAGDPINPTEDRAVNATEDGTVNATEDDTSLRYTSGWYSEERGSDSTWRWTQQTAVLSFGNPRADATLSLDYRARPNVFTDAPQVVTVSLGGEVLRSVVADASGRHSLRIPIPAAVLGPEDLAEIQIAVDRTFAPAKVNPDSSDTRELGIQVYYAGVEPDPLPTP